MYLWGVEAFLSSIPRRYRNALLDAGYVPAGDPLVDERLLNHEDPARGSGSSPSRRRSRVEAPGPAQLKELERRERGNGRHDGRSNR